MADGAPQTTAAPRKRLWLRVVAVLVLLFVVLVAWLALTAPLSRALEPLESPALVLEAADGTAIARRGSYKEQPVDVTKLPPHVGQAFIAIEDRRFYDHWGIDLRGITRAMMANARAGRVVEGGSTITQQLAKTSFLSLERSLTRKAREAIIALWLEAWLSKDEILSRYLSSVYFGDGAYGISAAAKQYFNKRPEQLNVPEAAMLAGLVKAPSRLAPTNDYDAARARGKVVIQRMIDNGFLAQSEARKLRPPRLNPGRTGLPGGSYFVDWVWSEAAKRQEGRYGEVRVRTTLDAPLQAAAERIVRQQLDSKPWLGAKQAALVAMRRDGTVVALVGGRDYKDSRFNRATQAARQPGSAFKLFVYLAALRSGMAITDTVEDRPLTIGDWSPANHEGKYRGTISLRSAFAASSNVAAAWLANEVGTRAIIKAAQDLGVTSDMSRDLTVALGTSTMSLMELTATYAAIAAGEYPIKPHGLVPEADKGLAGRVSDAIRVTRGFPEREGMEQMLLSAVRNGTGLEARLPIPAYGKTGTTQDYRDALFVGYAGDLVVGVWVGNDDNSPMNGVTGAGLPAQIWRSFMMDALPELRQRTRQAAEARALADSVMSGDDITAAVDAAIADIDTGDPVGDLISANPVETAPAAQEDAAPAAAGSVTPPAN